MAESATGKIAFDTILEDEQGNTGTVTLYYKLIIDESKVKYEDYYGFISSGISAYPLESGVALELWCISYPISGPFVIPENKFFISIKTHNSDDKLISINTGGYGTQPNAFAGNVYLDTRVSPTSPGKIDISLLTKNTHWRSSYAVNSGGTDYSHNYGAKNHGGQGIVTASTTVNTGTKTFKLYEYSSELETKYSYMQGYSVSYNFNQRGKSTLNNTSTEYTKAQEKVDNEWVSFSFPNISYGTYGADYNFPNLRSTNPQSVTQEIATRAGLTAYNGKAVSVKFNAEGAASPQTTPSILQNASIWPFVKTFSSRDFCRYDDQSINAEWDFTGKYEPLTWASYPKSGSVSMPSVTKTGYTQNTWSDEYGNTYNNNWAYTLYGSGGSGSGDSHWVSNNSVTLSANFIANTYQLTFNANGGTLDTIGQQTKTIAVTYDGKYGTNGWYDASKTGYTYNGMYTAQSGGTQVKNDTIYKIAGNSTIFAQYTPNVYKLTFNGNATGVTDIQGDMWVVYDSAITTVVKIPKRKSHVFLGYYDQAEGGTQYFNSAGVSTIIKYQTPNNITLYAQWREVKDITAYVGDRLVAIDKVYTWVDGNWAEIKKTKIQIFENEWKHLQE